MAHGQQTLYQRSTIGAELLSTLTDMIDENTIDEQVALLTLRHFDEVCLAVNSAMRRPVRNS